MKRLLLLLLILVPAEAQAISRYRSTSLSCNEVKSIVRNEGAVLMRWTSQRVRNLPRFERIVARESFCEYYETTDLITIPTADRAECPVLRCERRINDGDDFFRRRR